jgi:hypothetical protein
MFSNLFNRAVYEITWKYSSAGQATDGSTAHAHCMLEATDYNRPNS